MKKLLAILFLTGFLFSCASVNRLTSPKPIEPKTTEWNFGATIDPTLLRLWPNDAYGGDEGNGLIAFEPVVGFRRGINERIDLGLRLHGLLGPQFVFDFKHVFFNRNDFYFSGDLAVMLGIPRTIGPQYDIIFGKEKIYGTMGVHVNMLDSYQSLHYQAGIGGMNINDSNFGWQVCFGIMQVGIHGYPMAKLGFVHNFIPKKYRKSIFN